MASVADSVITQVGEHAEAHFGTPPAASASVTFLGLEAIEVQCFTVADLLHFVSVGCARDPMADPAEMIADPERGPRAEVVVSLRPSGGIPTGLHKSVAILAAAPAVEGVVLAPDGIVDLDEPVWSGAGFTAVLLGESSVPDLILDAPREPVRFLDAVPITATEAAWVRVRGAEELRAAWREADIDCHDPFRRAVSM